MNATTEKSLFSNWHLMRWMALIGGLFFILQALRYADWISGFLGVFLLFQAYTNSGCIVGACGTSLDRKNKEPQSGTKDIEFTEIKES